MVFVLGGPGSGKGTQCAKISKDYGFTHLSAGDLLREEVKRGTSSGKQLEELMKNGLIVPSDVTVRLLKEAMQRAGWDKSKFLVDGFPRNKESVEIWNKIMGDDAELKIVLFYDCSFEMMEKRLIERGKSSGRVDDNAETIKKRFDTFVNDSKPVVDAYEVENKTKRISADAEIEVVYQETTKILDQFFSKN